MGVKWDCKIIRGQREPLEVEKYPSLSSRSQTTLTIPKGSLWENLHQMPAARRPQAPQMSICYTLHSGTTRRNHISSWHVRVVDGVVMTKTKEWPWMRFSACNGQKKYRRMTFISLTFFEANFKLILAKTLLEKAKKNAAKI